MKMPPIELPGANLEAAFNWDMSKEMPEGLDLVSADDGQWDLACLLKFLEVFTSKSKDTGTCRIMTENR